MRSNETKMLAKYIAIYRHETQKHAESSTTYGGQAIKLVRARCPTKIFQNVQRDTEKPDLKRILSNAKV